MSDARTSDESIDTHERAEGEVNDAPATGTADSPGSAAKQSSAEPAGSAREPAAESAGAKSSAESGKLKTRAFFGKLSALRRPRVLVSVLVVALLFATIGFLGIRLNQETTARTNRDEALAAGKTYALALTSYDFHNLNGNFGAVAQNSSPRFAAQYKQVSDSLTKLIQQYQATSKGTVVNQGVASADDQRVVLTLFVDQAVTNTNNPQPRVDRNRMRMTLVHSGERWLVDDVQLV